MARTNKSKLERYNGALDAFREELAIELLNRINARTPYRSGYMLSRNDVSIDASGNIVFRNDAPYFDFVNNGTELQPPQRIVESVLLEKEDMAKLAWERALARAR